MEHNSPVISLCGVTRRFPAGDGFVTILDRVNLEIAAGEVVAVVGPSGSGKSTLLNILGLVDRPDEGSVTIASETVTAATSEDARARIRRRSIGFVFQHFHLIDSLTVLRNTALPAMLNGLSDPADRARELLNKVGLSARLDAYPYQLSGGEMQRCAIARALIHAPSLVLADEPTGSLDASSGAAVLELLMEVVSRAGSNRAALVIATHSAKAAGLAGRKVDLGVGAGARGVL